MELVLTCKCGQKNRVKLAPTARCGRCKSLIDVETMVAQFAAIVQRVAGMIREVPLDEREDDLEEIAAVFTVHGICVDSAE